MPQMSPMTWLLLTTLMLISYMTLLNYMPNFSLTSLKNKKISNKKINMKW